MSTRKSSSKPKAAKKATAKPTASRPTLAAVPPRQAGPGRDPKAAKVGRRPAAARAAKSPPAAKSPRAAKRPRAAEPLREAKAPELAAAPRRNSSGRALTPKDLKRLEELLLEERQRLLRELGHMENHVLKRSLRESSGELSGYSFHMADVGTDAMEREKAFHFASAEGRALLDVDAALRRLYGGEYGMCESCGQPVGKERLEIVPHARLCVGCKEKEERAQNGRSR